MIKRALISVSDKTGLEELVEFIKQNKVEVVASSGTSKKLIELGCENVKDVSGYTGYPESPGGLLKTLHPKIHGGILLDRDDPEQRDYLVEHDIQSFDLVIVNLYPFEAAVDRGAGIREAAENIDIGGPTMIRAAAKSALLSDRVTVVVDPAQYGELIKEIGKNDGLITSSLRRRLAKEAFKRTMAYEAAIFSYLERQEG
jgi:phosphoribosylaminoimidazolecarboxamide formyltransferase/IMP cyclohydrolase